LLHPPLLEELGLAAALSWYVEGFTRRSGIRIHFEVPPEMTRLPRDVELALFRIVQESLTNAHRHSASPPVNIRLMRDSWQVTLTVVDQGRGLPPGLQQRIHNVDPVLGVGIAGMRERVRQLRGQLNIQSGNQGTTLTVILPVASGDA
jgi:signal transduction histidine kinase